MAFKTLLHSKLEASLSYMRYCLNKHPNPHIQNPIGKIPPLPQQLQTNLLVSIFLANVGPFCPYF